MQSTTRPFGMLIRFLMLFFPKHSIWTIGFRTAMALFLALASNAPGAEEAELLSDLQRDSQIQAEQCYSLEGIVPGYWADVELVMLVDRAPVELDGRLKMMSSLPSSLREVSRRIIWKAKSGVIEPVRSDNSTEKALWRPPKSSGVVEVMVDAWIELAPIEGARKIRPFVVEKRVEFKFLVPADASRISEGAIDGYHIGRFPDPLNPPTELLHLISSHWHEMYPDRYRIPPHFYRVDLATKGLRISPHLTLGHFVIDYPWGTLGMPQYIALDINLALKMEELIELMKRDGRFAVSGVTPIYGYRSPAFNLGTIATHMETTKKVVFSMHQYGRAFDFIIDEDGDLVLDDLNGDGVHDLYDAAEIMHYVNILDRQYRAEGRWEMLGGAGLYDSHDFVKRVQSPYVHVDTRGFTNENGHLIRWCRRGDMEANTWPDGSTILWGAEEFSPLRQPPGERGYTGDPFSWAKKQ